MIHCYLVRHAQSQPSREVDQDDWPLSSLGSAQALELRDELSAYGIERIYSSPYPRALATVKPLADALGCGVVVMDDLRERRLSTQYIDDWRVQVAKTWLDFDYAPPSGESSRACQQRMLNCLAQILRGTRATRIAVCSHGNAIALLLNALEPSFGFEQWGAMRNPHVYRLTWQADALDWVRESSID
jgi:2,3-bisphosphoglycerate-dependent phosphoglycerate mutase